jgi:phage terminase small subunit
MLATLNVMAGHHTLALALLVDALADWIRLSEETKDADPLVAGAEGGQYANPIFKMKDIAWSRVMRACREFGATPAAVSAVRGKADESETEKPKEKSRFFPDGPSLKLA